MKSKNPAVLRPVSKANNSTSASQSAPCAQVEKGTTCAQAVNNFSACAYPPVLPDLFAGCAQEVMTRAKEHVDHATGTDRALLDGWRKVGREDAHRPRRPEWRRAAANSMTPLGIACLLEYARAYEDEHTAMRADVPS